MRKRIENGILLAGTIAVLTMIAICGWRTGEEMKVEEIKSAIPAEEASWTQSRSWGKGEWYENFEVIK
jgi:hypothetical protein